MKIDIIKKKILRHTYAETYVVKDSSGKGEHCFCIDIDVQRGVKKCCKCLQWNVQGKDWTNDE